jgi:hypothetical protein
MRFWSHFSEDRHEVCKRTGLGLFFILMAFSYSNFLIDIRSLEEFELLTMKLLPFAGFLILQSEYNLNLKISLK